MDRSELKKELRDLLKLESGLSEWEVEFIESLSKWEGEFTSRQANALSNMWDKHF